MYICTVWTHMSLFFHSPEEVLRNMSSLVGCRSRTRLGKIRVPTDALPRTARAMSRPAQCWGSCRQVTVHHINIVFTRYDFNTAWIYSQRKKMIIKFFGSTLNARCVPNTAACKVGNIWLKSWRDGSYSCNLRHQWDDRIGTNSCQLQSCYWWWRNLNKSCHWTENTISV